jgi:biopolymer transport protein ExbD
MGFNLNQSDDAISDINITPFVDVVLVLLIIFMVTAKFIVAPAIKVDLPKAVSEDTLDKERPTLTIFMDGDGQIAFSGLISQLTEGGQESVIVKPVEIVPWLKRVSAKFPEAQVAIQADRLVPHGRVIGMIDLLKTNGIHTFAFNVDPSAKEMLFMDPAGENAAGSGSADATQPQPDP